ncbi:AraC family transcriptional regulator [Niallia taxi]|uniref:AraC family transcriptional regulator n=1 Tax=Niallia taxi TaxID=2499688 RepID=A0A3S2TWG8_9BACI|nr:AraC family transcriptional regulator [Niallia taxi]MCM3217834.1 AraC family transcriptional regulator [Niallia taxi]MDK8638919.1 AraC family transcriptional regulator [Niallia taxi]MED4036725.1 AraC family transcriptional regulator [Niallia taxi]MED4053459.1 AraC family transcriptional regulator [Niallia taxi]MED4119299.1 AraC family transcriptional regulator [Niallia taxi]
MIKNTYEELVNEVVHYENPLLSLKVWEINEEPAYTAAIEKETWHFHKEVEFLAIIEGNLAIQHQYQSTVIGEGDTYIMGASQPHRTCKQFEGNLRYIVFQVDLLKHFDQSILPYLHCFSEVTTPLQHLNYIFNQNDATKKQVYNLIIEIYMEAQKKEKGYEIAINAAIKKLLLLLIRNDEENLLKFADADSFTRLKPVLDYIEDHLKDKLFVEEACAILNLSYHYFIKYFKKSMGVSFIDYVNLKRIKKAELLLLTSEKSIMEISFDVGISNIAQFYKLFKRHNLCSPKEYRLRMQQNAVV